MPKITVIMPSLNVVKYIRPCIESVLAQTLSDMEILAIDAGSEDGTLQIIEEYALTDRRIKVIHSDKKSYGYQLNLGISLAQGDYIGIVETDDMIVPDMYEALYNTAIKANADYVKGGFKKFIAIGTDYYWSDSTESAFPIDKKDLGKIIEPRMMPELLTKDIYLWTGIYKKHFVSKVLLNETFGAAFQDQGFLFQTISSAQKAVYINKVVYMYRQDNNNSSIFNQRGFHYIVEEYKYIEKFLIGKEDEWIAAYYTRMLNQSIGRFEMMAASGFFWKDAVPDIEILRGKIRDAVENNFLKPKNMTVHRWETVELFLQGAKEIYQYCVKEFQERIKVVYDVWSVVARQKVVIFGCGRIGKFFHALMDSKCPNQVIAYCDNNSELWHTAIQGILVLSPEGAVRQYPDAVYVIANLRNAAEIKRQLLTLGVVDESICIYQGYPDILLFHINTEQFFSIGDRMGIDLSRVFYNEEGF